MNVDDCVVVVCGMRGYKHIPIGFIFFYQFYQEHVEQVRYLLKFLNEKASTKSQTTPTVPRSNKQIKMV